ncbi:MAG TPA: hypothetical protein VJ600_01415 [Holophagaceae bacterium]|nr:hypothetical protein [Holophagaceae bacterium]
MLIKVLLLAALLSWHGNSPSGKAAGFAGVYAGLTLAMGLLGLMAGGSLAALLVLTAVRFGAAFLFFWLLDRFHGMLGWVLAIGGALVLSIAL